MTIAVTWTDTNERVHIIGLLSREGLYFIFDYSAKIREALSHGFRVLPEFPDIHTTYRSKFLFSTFAQRIPSAARVDRDRMFVVWGLSVTEEDPFIILLSSTGTQVTDRIGFRSY